MDIFRRVALQGLKRNRTRTLVTILGVVLSAAMITAVATFAVSLQRYMINGAIMKYGDWQVAFLDVDSSFVEAQAKAPQAANVASFENLGYAMLDGGQNPDKPYLFIAGFHKNTFDTLPIHLLSGRLPENGGEVLIPSHVATNGGVQISVGDTLTLAVGARQAGVKTLGQHDPFRSGKESLTSTAEKTYTVVGICQRPAFEERSAPGYTLITTADGGRITTPFTAFVTLKKPAKVHSYAKSTAGSYAYVFNDEVLRFMGLSNDTMFNGLLYSIGSILIALIMLGSIFLIYNSFTISLNDRTRQLGILLSVGATEKQLRNSVLFEGFCIGVIGIPIGILIGIPSIDLVLSLVAKNFRNILYDNVSLALSISFPALAIAAAVSMVTILISAYIPARKAVSTPVMDCIRQTSEIKAASKAFKSSKCIQRMFGVEGNLAHKNFQRNKKRYRSIVLSLLLSAVLFVSASSFGADLKQVAEGSVVKSDYDICFYTKDIAEGELFQLYDELKTAKGVTESSYQAISTYSCEVNTRDFSDSYRASIGEDRLGETVKLSLDIQLIEDSIYWNFIKGIGLPLSEYTGQAAKMIVVAKGKPPGLVDMFANRSMEFTLTSASGKQTKTIHTTLVDTYPEDTLPVLPSQVKPYVLMVVAPYQMKPQFDPLEGPTTLGLTFRSESPAQSTAQMQSMLEGAGISSEYTLYNVYAMLEQNRNILFIVNLFTVVFVMMISLIAVANVFNTISTNLKLRRRELAMLRSVGMSDRDFNRMMCFECAFYGLRTMLLGLPIAGIFSWLIYKGLILGGADIIYRFPWSSMGISMLGVFFVIFITMLYAVRKIKKENIMDALRDDMI